MIVVTKGYRVVPQLLICTSHPHGGHRHLHLRQNKGNLKVSNEDGTKGVIDKDQVLFVGNVDDQGGRLCERTIEDRLRRAFGGCGVIEHIRISRTEVDATSPAPPAGKKPLGSRLAYICFSSPEGVQAALSLSEIPSGLCDEGQDGLDVAENEVDRNRRLGNMDENGDVTCGLAALLQRHRRLTPPREELLAKVDSAVQRFEEAEAAEAARRREMLERGEDEDGFTMVTYKKRGRPADLPVAKEDGPGVAHDGRGKKRRGAGSLPDFYRFQMRESKREHLAKLREKFEKDKARVAKMKEQRKFKPF